MCGRCLPARAPENERAHDFSRGPLWVIAAEERVKAAGRNSRAGTLSCQCKDDHTVACRARSSRLIVAQPHRWGGCCRRRIVLHLGPVLVALLVLALLVVALLALALLVVALLALALALLVFVHFAFAVTFRRRVGATLHQSTIPTAARADRRLTTHRCGPPRELCGAAACACQAPLRGHRIGQRTHGAGPRISRRRASRFGFEHR